MSSIDYIVTMAPVKGWDILMAAREQSVLEFPVLESGSMGKQKDQNDFDEGQMTRSEHL